MRRRHIQSLPASCAVTGLMLEIFEKAGGVVLHGPLLSQGCRPRISPLTHREKAS